MSAWQRALGADPLPWLLEEATPAVRHMALRDLLDRPADDPRVREARDASMQSPPIADILAAQHPDGYWVKPGPGYSTKYRGTVWQVVFLDQLGADGDDPRVRAACAYVLAHTQAVTGGFGASGRVDIDRPPPASVVHCINGNLLRALLGFGWQQDERVQQAIDWQARAITGEGFERYYQAGTSGPNFGCAANDEQPCAWGAVKATLALVRVPVEQRAPHVVRAIEQGGDFLLSRDPAVADCPMSRGNVKPNRSWFKLGFPSGYVTDVLQNLEALCELGFARDPRLEHALAWLLAKQDERGRWQNEYAYTGKTWVDIERQGQASKLVTLRVCRVLRATLG